MKFIQKPQQSVCESKGQDGSAALTCEELEGFIVDYLDNNLLIGQQQTFAQHLKACPNCESYVKNNRQTVRLTKAAFDKESESDCEEMPDALVKAILASHSTNYSVRVDIYSRH
jgi:anti-sigma factor RsiW